MFSNKLTQAPYLPWFQAHGKLAKRSVSSTRNSGFYTNIFSCSASVWQFLKIILRTYIFIYLCRFSGSRKLTGDWRPPYNRSDH